MNPVEQARLVGTALQAPLSTMRRVTETMYGLTNLADALWPATPSSLTGPIGRSRRYAMARAPLADVLEIRKRAQVSLNDVVLAAISGGFRSLLCARG